MPSSVNHFLSPSRRRWSAAGTGDVLPDQPVLDERHSDGYQIPRDATREDVVFIVVTFTLHSRRQLLRSIVLCHFS